jgi:hypothetical protein
MADEQPAQEPYVNRYELTITAEAEVIKAASNDEDEVE